MDKAFAEITKGVNVILDHDFMMKCFEPLEKKIKPLKYYLTYMFEEWQICPVRSQE